MPLLVKLWVGLKLWCTIEILRNSRFFSPFRFQQVSSWINMSARKELVPAYFGSIRELTYISLWAGKDSEGYGPLRSGKGITNHTWVDLIALEMTVPSESGQYVLENNKRFCILLLLLIYAKGGGRVICGKKGDVQEREKKRRICIGFATEFLMSC